jgi:hypothetical protein
LSCKNAGILKIVQQKNIWEKRVGWLRFPTSPYDNAGMYVLQLSPLYPELFCTPRSLSPHSFWRVLCRGLWYNLRGNEGPGLMLFLFHLQFICLLAHELRVALTSVYYFLHPPPPNASRGYGVFGVMARSAIAWNTRAWWIKKKNEINPTVSSWFELNKNSWQLTLC